ncbi:MAG: Anaerobic sulfite reductase subunit A [candidate division TA06 bacterium ADurb.Bin131]|uniref:Anaerobic sulfite reductase subunit A n=1 Tax=candidate division TA06 bacterium ADurb.Bin131 TaxID=1852827 RepID=A0A1V6C561_UNCT6|nr:MAG: Anaerobic sulfite reductase subunit A [candidate division TA06 bacterium ADurb.Bin131]
MNTYFIEKKRWFDFLEGNLDNYSIIAPFSYNDALIYEPLSLMNLDRAVFGIVRPVQPLKSFFFPFKERVVPEILEQEKQTVIIGAANCDLSALRILDSVFLNQEYKDPNYRARRQNTTVVSIDCANPLSVCFCDAVGLKPYPDDGFDLNLSIMENGFFVDVGSKKGENLISNKDLFRPAKDIEIEERNKIRSRVRSTIVSYNESFHLPRNISEEFPENFASKIWEKIWQRCVQCGGCTSICPSCVCFFLEDTSNRERFIKNKIYDSCLLPGYARMASGLSPRPLLWERYRNRFACKYSYIVSNYGRIGCTGCGRCIAGCPGKIDKRKVLRNIFLQKDEDVGYESVKYL